MGKYKGFTDARKKANDKYFADKVENIMVRVPKGEKDNKYRAAADNAGMSLNQFMIKAADEKIDRDKLL